MLLNPAVIGSFDFAQDMDIIVEVVGKGKGKSVARDPCLVARIQRKLKQRA